MALYIICPFCGKTIVNTNGICAECGQRYDFNQVQKQGLVVDYETEKREYTVGKDYFTNTEFLSAKNHFSKALAANANSYLSKYFVQLCDIYLNEGLSDYDVMRNVVNAILEPLELLNRSNVTTITDKIDFVNAVLSEVKIIILNRLRSHGELYDIDIAAYRKNEIKDLQLLLKLFKADGELLMTYAPTVQAILGEIADYAVAICHKAVQTVAIGEDLYTPTEFEYNRLLSLNSDFCYYASLYVKDYDAKKYTPDFTQCDLLNDKVMSRFIKYEAKNKASVKKRIIVDLKEYDDILSECEKAVEFSYQNCFRAICDKKYSRRGMLLKDGLRLLYRILTPRVVINDDKRPEFKIGMFVDIAEKCEILSEFLEDANEFDQFARDSLKEFYDNVCDILDMHFVDQYERFTKNINKLKESQSSEDFKYYECTLYEVVKISASALKAYVPFNESKDKSRAKLVNYCKQAAEEFLMLHDYNIDELDKSNVYRPVLDIYNAVMHEKNM